MTTKKKVGCFFLALLAFPAALVVQNLIIIPLMGFRTIYFFASGEAKSVGPDLGGALIDLAFDGTFLDAVQLVYAVAIVILFGIWFYKAFHKESVSYAAAKRRIPVLILGLLLLSVGGQYLAELIYEIVAGIAPAAAESYEELVELSGFDQPSLMTLIYGIVMGPIAEELIFRGVMLRYLQKALPFAAANVIQAVLFGIYHMNLMQAVYTGAIGLLFGYISYRSGNLWFSTITHIIFNIFGFTNVLFLASDNPYFNFLWLPLMILTLILGSMLFFGKLGSYNPKRVRVG